MITIKSYPLGWVTQVSEDSRCWQLSLPMRHTLLDAQIWDGTSSEIRLWAEVDTESEMGEFRFWLIGDGDQFPLLPEGHYLVYLRTLQSGGHTVHLYQQQFRVQHPIGGKA
jgi:hypothetical protein